MRKRVTSKDVADQVGVSRTTVSLVLNNVPGIQISTETRQKVIDAANELGYVPDATAQALASRRAKAIGLVMTRSPHHIASDTFLPQIMSGMMEVVRNHKLRLLFEYVEEEHREHAYLDLARAKHIDGMILLTPRLDDAGLKKLEQVDVPTVLMGEIVGSSLYSVDVDNQLAARKAVQYLLDLDHRQIACISNAPASYTASPERVRGYKTALTEAGIQPNDDLIRYADFTPESGYTEMKSLLSSKKKFTAVFVASDNVAMGAKAALREAGMQIPEDISLVGFDDIPWAQFADPPLTTVHLQAQELARRACLVLMDLLKGREPETKRQIVETQLVVRKSCRQL
ncbi:MAG TPA: LacI family DNA-binding transcriptional regulator [Anaerolineales bacterium]|nr:LacI family DNA-binding transcriptional regulator [Anaerolineales bacterium]